MNLKNQSDQVTLVNESDQVIGEMDKIEAHHGDAHRHRAISVYLFRQCHPDLAVAREGSGRNTEKLNNLELLIQQRSIKKILGATQWANTVCGNVWPGESYESCAKRRLEAELGITDVDIKPTYKFEYHLACNDQFSEWEIDQVFVGFYDGLVQPNPAEVQDYAWVNWPELQNTAESANMDDANFNTKSINLKDLSAITAAGYSDEIILAPWFASMLIDRILLTKIMDELNIK